MDAPLFLIVLLQIIGVNIVLSGDNAVVIALAARSLPAAQQRKAVAWGSGAAVVMRIVLTIVAVKLLQLPYLKIVGALLLVWIAVKLLIPESGDEGDGEAAAGLAGAIRTILIADLAMSLDNVIAVAAVAKGDMVLLIIGLAISIPMVVFASRLLLRLMDRFPLIVTAGAALLGWVAGEMLISDPVSRPWMEASKQYVPLIVPALCAAGVVLGGNSIATRAARGRIQLAEVVQPAVEAAEGVRRILLAVDGSQGSLAAVRKVIAMHAALPAMQVSLTNVQRGVPSDAAAFVPRETLKGYHRENSDAALKEPAAMLDAAGVPYTRHQFVGDPGRVIAAFAQEQKIEEIVMGARGLGTHTGALLGSVTKVTLEHATVPVLVVK